MMHMYGRIEDGHIVEIIAPVTWPNGSEIPVAQRFTPEIVATLVDITNVSPQPEYGWKATEKSGKWTFVPSSPPEQNNQASLV